MCGVVGVKLDEATLEQKHIVEKVLKETELRGRHASGLAWYDGEELQMLKKSLPISELLNGFCLSDCYQENDDIRMIAHIRYSTSDIEYHQPLGSKDDMFIVHNGVISQEEPEKWEEMFGFECETKNDSELIYHALKDGEDIYTHFGDVSISALSLDADGNMKNYRNGLRPQWISIFENGYIITSTKNIAIRAGIDPQIIKKITPEFERTFNYMDTSLEKVYKGYYNG